MVETGALNRPAKRGTASDVDDAFAEPGPDELLDRMPETDLEARLIDEIRRLRSRLPTREAIVSTPRRFELYRRKPPEQHTSGGYANAPGEVQLQGVVFADGTVAIRWLTPLRSTSVWSDFETFDKVHGHPEYESELCWLDTA